MAERPTVSVIIPTYNRAYLIDRSIQSVLNQTYQDFELIVVDDGSTDNTEDIIRQFQEKDKRIKYIKHDKNKGGSTARNIGIKIAQGNYVAFLDDDDEWLREKLRLQVKLLNDKEVDIVACDIISIENNQKYIKSKNKSKYNLNNLLWENAIGSTSIIMVKTKLALKVLFDEELTAAQDYDFYVRCLQNCDFIYNIKKPLAKIHIHMGPRITTSGNKKYKGNRRFILKHYNLMNKAQRRYHLYKYRLLEWPKNPRRSFKYLFKALKFHPWWDSIKGWKKVVRVIVDGLRIRFYYKSRG